MVSEVPRGFRGSTVRSPLGEKGVVEEVQQFKVQGSTVQSLLGDLGVAKITGLVEIE